MLSVSARNVRAHKHIHGFDKKKLTCTIKDDARADQNQYFLCIVLYCIVLYCTTLTQVQTILSFWPNNENYVISFMQFYWFVLLETRLNLNNIATLISFVSHFSSAIPSSYSDAAISCSCCSFKSASNLARSKSNFLMCLST